VPPDAQNLQDVSQAGLHASGFETVAVGVEVDEYAEDVGISLRFSMNPTKLCVCFVIDVLASPAEPCTTIMATAATSTLPPIINKYSKAPWPRRIDIGTSKKYSPAL